MGVVQSAMDIRVDDPKLEHWRGRFLALYEEKLGQRSAPYPGLLELVAVLGKAGIPWGVVTNKLARFALPLMDKMGFVPVAGTIVTPDLVRHPKPHPEAVTLGCHQLGCDPSRRCLSRTICGTSRRVKPPAAPSLPPTAILPGASLPVLGKLMRWSTVAGTGRTDRGGQYREIPPPTGCPLQTSWSVKRYSLPAPIGASGALWRWHAPTMAQGADSRPR